MAHFAKPAKSTILLGWSVICGSTVLLAGCWGKPAASESSSADKPAPASIQPAVGLTDITDAVGIQIRHNAGDNAVYEFPRSMGSGIAWMHADSDNRLDLLLVQGGDLSELNVVHPVATLLRQTEEGKLEDITSQSNLLGTGYGMGIAIGDVDRDGDEDIYLTKYGPDQLFLNDGQGHFTDITEEAGVSNLRWSTAAAMIDVNDDGWLDLVVVNYVDYFPGSFCADAASRQDFCGPMDFHGTPDRILLNRTQSPKSAVRFEDVSGKSLIASMPGKGLGLVCRDFNSDGQTDLFIANDGEPNFLWIQNEGVFSEEAVVRGVAVNRLGESEADMGTGLGDLNADGIPDLFVTHLSGEMNTVWTGNAEGYFVDSTTQLNAGISSLQATGFGTALNDLDHDGDMDILVVNGKVKRARFQASASSDFWSNYAESNLLLIQQDGRFNSLNDMPGWSTQPRVSRGLATADIDDDGDMDFAVSNIGQKPQIFRNDFPKRGHWLIVEPLAEQSANGVRIDVIANGRQLTAEILPHTSYLSSHEPVAHFGLGDCQKIDRVKIHWRKPDAFTEIFQSINVDCRVQLKKGSGKRMN